MRPCGERPRAHLIVLGVLMFAMLLSGEVGAQRTGQTVQIKGGETIQISAAGGRRFFLHFVAVVSDERCPARVRCAWANPPVIALETSTPGEATRIFKISPGGPDGVRLGIYLGVSIEYVDLLPVPQEIPEFSKLKPLEAYAVVLNIGTPKEMRR